MSVPCRESAQLGTIHLQCPVRERSTPHDRTHSSHKQFTHSPSEVAERTSDYNLAFVQVAFMERMFGHRK